MKTIVLVAGVLAAVPSRVVSHGATEPRPATDDWCINGTPLDIGECLCQLQTEDACQGSACFRQMGKLQHPGLEHAFNTDFFFFLFRADLQRSFLTACWVCFLGLSWYRPSCKDCSCRPDPSAKRSTKSSSPSAQPASVGKDGADLVSTQAADGEGGECDSECSWKTEKNGEAEKSSTELPPTATNALDAGPRGAQASGASGSGRSSDRAEGGYREDDNDQFEDGLEADDYLRMLGDLETEVSLLAVSLVSASTIHVDRFFFPYNIAT